MVCFMAFIVAVLLRRRKLRNELAALQSHENIVMADIPDPIEPQYALPVLTNDTHTLTLSRGEGVAAANDTNAVFIDPEGGSRADIVYEQFDELQVPGNENNGAKFQYENEEKPKDVKTPDAVDDGDV